jgi:hypothetical protein
MLHLPVGNTEKLVAPHGTGVPIPLPVRGSSGICPLRLIHRQLRVEREFRLGVLISSSHLISDPLW